MTETSAAAGPAEEISRPDERGPDRSRYHIDRPQYRIDPLGQDYEAEGRTLQALGPLVPVELTDGVRAWAVTRREVYDLLTTHPDLRKSPTHWRAYQDGEVPDSWPMLQLLVTPTMLIMDGLDHARLRKPVQAAFTTRRVEALRGRIEEIVAERLDVLAAAGPEAVVDLRTTFAFEIPVIVICELYGVEDTEERHQLTVDTALLMSGRTPPAERLAAEASIFGAMARLIADKRAHPGPDLTTALITEFDKGNMSEEELAGTLFLVLLAGHETTQDLICNVIRRLAEHPERLAGILEDGGTGAWRGVVEESLRLDPPAPMSMFLYPVRDMAVAGVTLRAGDPILCHLSAISRDDEVFGDPHTFAPGRPNAHQHRAFGHGPHHCLGAPLARLEAIAALPALYERFTITLAEPSEEIESVASSFVNAPARLPVRLAVRRPGEDG
ncbi:cytochrome P450 [Streptomyces sp. NPDC093252]|uniref:cytochrome P450 family protein n=1 Tax=Streptomyces sp. NPDC093252 TaxID=3154980 RepID=UPI003439D27F